MKRSLILPVLILTIALVGCGSGGGSSNSSSRQRAISSARISRQTFAVAGLTRRITRGPKKSRTRLAMFASAIVRGRSTEPGFDEQSGFYYQMTVQDDGSGQIDLFLDTAHTQPAGAFTWGIPDWAGGVPNSYPAVIHVHYEITAGKFAGVHGDLDVTIKDANGKQGLIHLVLRNSKGDRCTGDFVFDDWNITGDQDCQPADSDPYTEHDVTLDNGDMQGRIIYIDGTTELFDWLENGGGTESITDPNGHVDLNGSFDDSGSDTISYDDGTYEIIDLDTGEVESSRQRRKPK